MAPDDIEDVPIRDDMIRLGQLMKLANLAEDGLQAKEFIENSQVQVNGETETRRGRQLHTGATVSFRGQTVRVTRR